MFDLKLNPAALAVLAILVAAGSQGARAEEPRRDKALRVEHDQAWSGMLRILNQRVSLSVTDAPLEEVIRRLSARTGALMLIDATALDDLGFAPDEPITWSMSNVRLQTLLEEMLGQIELTWSYRNETLIITTEEEAETQLVTRVYPVGDLLAAALESRDGYPLDSLIDTVVSTVASETWAENGGGEAEIRLLLSAQALVISQTVHTHLEIERLLSQVRRVGRAQGVALWEPGTVRTEGPKPPVAKRTYVAPTGAVNLSRVHVD